MSQEVKPIKLKNLPVIYRKKILWKRDLLPIRGNVKVVKPPTFQEDVLYESKNGGFSVGDLHELTIVNRLNKANNTSRTVAKCKSDTGDSYEKTSDEITKIIGQNNYDILFTTLCSVINQELKIKSIFSLLTYSKEINKENKEASCQTESVKVNMECQTEDTFINLFKKTKIKRRMKRSHLTAYVVREPEIKKAKRVVITPKEILNSPDNKDSQTEASDLPDLGSVFDEDFNNSFGKFSMLSFNTTSDIMHEPLKILEVIDKNTRDINAIGDGDNIEKTVPFHEKLQSVPPNERVKMLLKQGLIDWQTCLTRDISGHLPIHVAVLNSDLDLLKRQCLVLKMRGVPVDIPADNLTPLKMSLYQDNVLITAHLVQQNADILDTDAQDRTCFHIAAEMATEHLQVLIAHCQHNARKILQDNGDLWKCDYETKSDDELVQILFTHINKLYDNQGYTPLMLACKQGRYENVKALVETSPSIINDRMPNSGNTALYIAVAAACMDSTDRCNKSKVVDHFRKTVEILVDYGANPNICNFNGDHISNLLTEYNIGDLSMLIANKLTNKNFGGGKIPLGTKICNAFMLIKDDKGAVEPYSVPKYKNVERKSSITTPKVTKNTKETLIIKSETITARVSKNTPTKGKTATNKNKKNVVQNFTLNKPLILKTIKTKSNTKLEISQPDSSNTNAID